MTTSIVPQGWGRRSWSQLPYGEGAFAIAPRQVSSIGTVIIPVTIGVIPRQVSRIGSAIISVGANVELTGIGDIGRTGLLVTALSERAVPDGVYSVARLNGVDIESLWVGELPVSIPQWQAVSKQGSVIWSQQSVEPLTQWVEINPNNA